MDDPIGDIERALEERGRECLRLIVSGSLDAEQTKTLAKWMFGCMNQRFTIRSRVGKRGVGELAKVLRFIARACEALLEIDSSEQT